VSKYITWPVLLIVSAIWGGAFAAIKFILDYIGPGQLLYFRFVPTALISIAAIAIFYQRDSIRLFSKYWRIFIAICILWLFGYHYALNVGETVLPAGAAGLIIGTYPIFTIFLAAIFGDEKLTPQKITGGLIAFLGTAFLVIFGASHEGALLNIPPARWILYGLITFIAPVSAAVHTIIAKPYLTGKNRDGVKIDPILMTFLYMSPSLILLVPFIAASPVPDFSSFGSAFWVSLGFLVIFCTIGAYIGWLWAIERIGAGPVAISTYIIPLFSLAYARIWLNEPIGIPTIVAAAFIVAGVVIANSKGIGGRRISAAAESGE
jgi:drug/metabolite transporter (DMT)-like permease